MLEVALLSRLAEPSEIGERGGTDGSGVAADLSNEAS